MEIEVKKSSKLVDYKIALRFLEKRVKDVINGKKPELLWLLEHKPIFTAGTSYKENEILNKNIKVILVKQPQEFFTRNILDEVNKFSTNELIEKYKKDYFLKKFNLDKIKNFWIVLGTIINKNLDYFNKFENVIIVDPINKLTSTNLNFTDVIHLTPVGNYVLASETAKSILLKN